MANETTEKILTFDDLTNTVPPEVAAARGDLHESDEPIDPFSMTEKAMGGFEEDGALGEMKGEPAGKEGEPGKQVESEVEGKANEEGDDLTLEDGQVENIPYPRFKKSILKNQTLAAEVERLRAENEQLRQPGKATGQQDGEGVEGQQAVTPAPQPTPKLPAATQEKDLLAKIADKASEHSDAVIDGDHDTATRIMAEMMELQSDLSTERSMVRMAAQKQQESISSTVDDLVTRHAEYFKSPVRLDIFTQARDSFFHQGYDMPTALAMAEKELAPMLQAYGGKAAGKDDSQVENSEVDETLKADGTLTDKARADILSKQDKESLGRNVDTHNRQPPKTNSIGKGNRQGVPAPRNALLMTSVEYNALSAREKAIARGDIVE